MNWAILALFVLKKDNFSKTPYLAYENRQKGTYSKTLYLTYGNRQKGHLHKNTLFGL